MIYGAESPRVLPSSQNGEQSSTTAWPASARWRSGFFLGCANLEQRLGVAEHLISSTRHLYAGPHPLKLAFCTYSVNRRTYFSALVTFAPRHPVDVCYAVTTLWPSQPPRQCSLPLGWYGGMAGFGKWHHLLPQNTYFLAEKTSPELHN